MKIREYENGDFEKVQQLANNHNIKLPETGLLYVAEDDFGEINNLIFIRNIHMVEPLIAESPFAGYKLYKKILEILSSKNVKILRAFANTKNVETYEKFGFKEVFKNFVIMEKEI